jgi:hypothetical protein
LALAIVSELEVVKRSDDVWVFKGFLDAGS